jgi:hypothetical protein
MGSGRGVVSGGIGFHCESRQINEIEFQRQLEREAIGPLLASFRFASFDLNPLE